MAYTTIDDPSAYFQTKIYTGTNISNALTNDGNSDLQPDFIWIKRRNYNNGHQLLDSTRGVDKILGSELTSAETTLAGRLSSFDTDGFTVESSSGAFNASGEPFVAWQWKANGGTTASNTDGSITSTVQANQDAGFSIGTFTGTGSAATIGHGLGVKPDMLILKSRNNPSGAAMYWMVAHVGLDGMTGTKNLFMNENWAADTSAAVWGNVAPTSSVFTVSTNAAVNYSGNNMLFYAFANKQGYSKFGSYKGNSSTDGTFVYLGFKPRWLMIKSTQAGMSWDIIDSTISTSNVMDDYLTANTSDPQGTSVTKNVDFLSNGFKWRYNNNTNFSDHTYIYMAFAENPFVTSKGAPGTAI